MVLVSTGLGSNAVDHYHGTVTDAPTSVLVVKDDQTGLRATLQPATHDRSRLRWSAPTRTPQVTVSVPGISTPFGTGADVRVDDVPPVFGFDWRSLGDLLTTLDIRATDDLTPFPDVVPPVATGTPGLIGRAAVRLGPGQPAATWPEAEATVGGEVHDGDQVNAFGAIAVRGLRWVALQLGTGTSDAAGHAEVHGHLLLGDDPSRPPGHDRGLRVLRERRSSAGRVRQPPLVGPRRGAPRPARGALHALRQHARHRRGPHREGRARGRGRAGGRRPARRHRPAACPTIQPGSRVLGLAGHHGPQPPTASPRC